ncbi:MAG: hypothetical protein ACC645_18965 [Pirellulales bacterium]
MENYGGGTSTGLDQSAAGKIVTGFVPEDLAMTPEDRQILRGLAERVAHIADSPRMHETRRLWTQLNMLAETRPLIFCDPENGWNEIITELQMQCRGKLARRWEMDLRKEIFWAEEMGDDKPVEPFFDVPYTVPADDWGLEVEYHRVDDAGSCVWDAPVKSYDTDLEKLQSPPVNIDWETTNGCLQIAEETLGNILEVRLKGTWWWSLGLTWPAATLRGLSNILCDFLDHPDELKELLRIISRGHLDKLDYLESHNLLSLNNDGTYVGSGGYGFTEELPQEDFDGHVRCADSWGFTESQETVNVSPAMYEEFIFPHEKPIMDRFGLTCYGCCEPVHSRWHVVQRHHNLRRVSCSPWVDLERMADALEDKYILSMKPNPVVLSTPEIDEAAIREDLRKAMDVTKGCRVEVIMKDNHTIGNRPENVTRWCRMAKEEAEKAAS